jgi:precorrin-4/cobalt-precorrin-4 C11-methyltransferase
MTVHFIGAGPGAADLITLRGARLLASCPVCLYAGSIVPPDLLAHCPPDARLVDTAPLSLDAIEAAFAAAHAAGQDVARLHSGDLSLYSAVAEQLRRLRRRGIPYTLTPGVPAFAAAAAAWVHHAADFKAWTRAVSSATNARGADLFMPLRAAITGETHGPELAAFTALVGPDLVARRLSSAQRRAAA